MVLVRQECKRTKECCICGNVFETKPSHWERRKTCGKECNSKRRKSMYEGENNPNYGNRGELNPLFKGGKRIRNGYVEIYKPNYLKSLPSGYILEHRFIMSEHLGRHLEDWEHVHHKDGNRQNNDINNLEILTRSEHTSLHNKQKEIIRCSESGRILKIVKRCKYE